MENNIQKYESFIAVAENGSFTKAAQITGYAQSSVSKMIADLETELGITLMERSRAGVVLTSEGEAMLPSIRELLASFRKVEDEAAALSGAITGTIRIGTFSSVATYWIPGIIAAFQKDYPGIRYELLLGDYHEIEGWIADGRVDCGFLCLPVREEFETIYLEKDEYTVVLPVGHPLAGKERIEPEDLNNQSFLLLENGNSRTEVSRFLDEYHLRPDIRFRTWNDYAILSMAEKGLGIGILPRLILRRNPFHVETRKLTVPFYREIGLSMKKKSTAPAAVKKFVQYLKFRNEPPC